MKEREREKEKEGEYSPLRMILMDYFVHIFKIRDKERYESPS
jgi:hypothetical protein